MMHILGWVEQIEGDAEQAVLQTPLGKFAMAAFSNVLIHSDWVADATPLQAPQSAFLQDLSAQLQCYWENPAASEFNARMLKQGSTFSRAVLDELCKIPCGETRSYGALAKRLRTSARAVGAACRNNPFTLLIPCHRVVAATGLGGYSGQRAGTLLDIKQRLLAHEGCRR